MQSPENGTNFHELNPKVLKCTGGEKGMTTEILSVIYYLLLRDPYNPLPHSTDFLVQGNVCILSSLRGLISVKTSAGMGKRIEYKR